MLDVKDCYSMIWLSDRRNQQMRVEEGVPLGDSNNNNMVKIAGGLVSCAKVGCWSYDGPRDT
jgi:hypothetical protein